MESFERIRARHFEMIASRLLERADPETGLIQSHRYVTGAHSQAGGFDIRAAAEQAVVYAVTGRAAQARTCLAATLDHQDRNLSSFTYGNFFWHSSWTTALDPNAVSFIVPKLWYLLQFHPDLVPADLMPRLKDALALSLAGINAHRATWGYTNIEMLNIASRVCIGDVLGDERAMRTGYWEWEEWRNHTARYGMITEYNSLTYTPVQVDAMAIMLACRADERFHREVRAVMRHLISSMVLDYHPAVGRITGPQSRAYDRDRRMRGRSYADLILHFVVGAPEPETVHAWFGVPIGPDDILPEARNAPIPRTTRVSSHGAVRVNRLEPDFALGSLSGRCTNSTHGTQFFLAWRSENPRCAIPFLTDDRNQPESHFSSQRNGSLLAASLWMLARETKDGLPREYWKGGFSGLNTGRPDCLVRDADFRPGYTLELGTRETVRLLGESGPVAAAGEIPGSCLAIETETIVAAVRFFTAGGPAAMRLVEEGGEMMLSVAGSREGVPVSRIETAAFCGFLLHVRPKKETAAEAALEAIAAAVVTVTAREDGWTLTGPASDGAMLTADVPAVPSVLYSTDGGERVTANLWAEAFR